jgi:hypothetical protein
MPNEPRTTPSQIRIHPLLKTPAVEKAAAAGLSLSDVVRVLLASWAGLPPEAADRNWDGRSRPLAPGEAGPVAGLVIRPPTTLRAGAVVKAAQDLGIEARVTGWDNDRIALDPEALSMLLDAYRETAGPDLKAAADG